MIEPKDRDIYVPGIYMLLELAAGGDLFDKIGERDALAGTLIDITDVSPRRRCWRRSGPLLFQPTPCWYGEQVLPSLSSPRC